MSDPSRIRVAIHTFGCRVNQYDSDLMRTLLEPAFEVTDIDPDVILLNACTVTGLAERKARQTARRLRRLHPSARIVTIGCLSDAVRQGTTRFEDADVLAGNAWKHHVHHVVELASSGGCGLLDDPVGDVEGDASPISRGPSDRSRAFLKIQDGCGRACTYCRATQVRGHPRSRHLTHVLTEADRLLESGFPELVLTGIDLAQYAPSDGTLADLVDRLCRQPCLQRLRLASINPSGLTPQLLKAFARHAKLSPHFHSPLQSGDDGILAAMARGYDAATYLAVIDRIRRVLPHATFGTDIIVGFPGEDGFAFAQTCRAIDSVGYVNLHVFRYSPRRGTRAAELPDQVPAEVKKRRSSLLLSHWESGLGALLDNRIGTTQDVLVEERRDDGWRGYTHDYLHVTFSTHRTIRIGSILPIRIVGRTKAALEGVDDHRTETR